MGGATITTTEDFHANMVFHQIQRAKFVQFFLLCLFFSRVPCGGRDGQVPWCFCAFFSVFTFFLFWARVVIFFVYYFLLHVTGENSFFLPRSHLFSVCQI